MSVSSALSRFSASASRRSRSCAMWMARATAADEVSDSERHSRIREPHLTAGQKTGDDQERHRKERRNDLAPAADEQKHGRRNEEEQEREVGEMNGRIEHRSRGAGAAE
jgi:hypothetical protein